MSMVDSGQAQPAVALSDMSLSRTPEPRWIVKLAPGIHWHRAEAPNGFHRWAHKLVFGIEWKRLP